MGNTIETEQEVIKVEMGHLMDGLMPEERARLSKIRETLSDPMKADYDHVKSFRTACDTACAGISHAMYKEKTDPVALAKALAEKKPTPVQEAVANACEQIRERVLNNSVFNIYS